MSVRLILGGVADLKTALRSLPQELTGDGGAIVREAATAAHHDVDAVFNAHIVTGNLERRLELVEVAAGRFGSVLKVVDRAKHAMLFEYGTVARHWHNGKVTGTMPAAHVFVNAMIRRRETMWGRLRSMVEAVGLKVSGRV